jgi:hypothetical protein
LPPKIFFGFFIFIVSLDLKLKTNFGIYASIFEKLK